MRPYDEYKAILDRKDHLKTLIREQVQLFNQRDDIKTWKAEIDKLEREQCEDCPECKKGKLMSQPGGGVKCDTPDCPYWFCY